MSDLHEALKHLRSRADGHDMPFTVLDAVRVDAELIRLRALQPPTDLPATLATVDDVRQVCEAVGLVRDCEHWRDERVIVTAITTSCLPLAPDDDRDMVGIFVDTAPESNWRADLNTDMQGWLLWYCIQAARSAS